MNLVQLLTFHSQPAVSRAKSLKLSRTPPRRLAMLLLGVFIAIGLKANAARAEAAILIEAESGKVLHAENATYPWYPASITKLMTAYTTLRAVKEGRISLDTLFSVSPIAAAQGPTKMGFKPGVQVTVDNALKMMMVRSANDMAVVLAEGLDGSIEKFADEMNRNAARLGMTQTSYVNPNGLPADGQITSARDMAMLARAIIRELPEYDSYFHIAAIRFGKRITRNYNSLIGRYPGADGMKTGFICASGFNLVATATRGGKRLITVVLGAPSSPVRAAKAVQLLEKGFNGNPLAWLTPSLGSVDQLQPIAASPPNLRDEICGPKRKRPAIESDDDNVAINVGGSGGESVQALSLFSTSAQAGTTIKPSEMLAMEPAPAEPVLVYTGPKREGAALLAAVAADEASQQTKLKGKRGQRNKLANAKPAAKPVDTKPVDTKSADTKPAADKQQAAKPDGKREANHGTTDAKPAAHKPAPKQAAAKPASPAAAKPAEQPKAAAKPAGTKLAAKPAADKKKDGEKSSQ